MLANQQLLGTYRVVRFLGAGGMGTVYEAEHTAMGTRHAVKVLGDQYAHSTSVRERFRREAQLMFQLGNHPHIVRATDLVDTPEALALVIDLVDGGDLAEALAARPGALPWPEAWRILEPVVAAVAHAHKSGVVHRDLKPENVLLRRDGGWPGVPLVTDFGIAKVLGSDSATRTQAKMGTACYGAPEQFKNAKEVGAEADVWALGMLAWRLVMGRLPIDPDNQAELLQMYLGQVAVPRLAGVPDAVAEAVAAALSVDPQRRPKDAAVLGKLLAAASAPPAVAVVAPPAVVPQAAAAPIAPPAAPRTNLGPWLLGGAVVVAAAIVYVGAGHREGGEPTAQPATVVAPSTPPAEEPPDAASASAPPAQEQPDAASRSAPASEAQVPQAPAPEGMVYLPPGTFTMGSPEGVGSSDEHPAHRVTLTRGFYLDRSEVTVAAYAECVQAGKCQPPESGDGYNWQVTGREQHPVNGVRWHDAVAYCGWAGKRLPTEAEWEYAARSGGREQTYPWGNEEVSCARAVMSDGGDGCGKDRTWPVCSKAAGNSAQGVCDLAGNVKEWVADAYDATAYASADGTGASVKNNKRNASRVLRGGSWCSYANNLRAANRSVSAPDYRDLNVGFRCSRTL